MNVVDFPLIGRWVAERRLRQLADRYEDESKVEVALALFGPLGMVLICEKAHLSFGAALGAIHRLHAAGKIVRFKIYGNVIWRLPDQPEAVEP